ncbi:MAG: Rieske (2Fe-2S) protein [Chlorobi bacterium]|nr:Rieske (2Fe-2S) protein [Chlorobiota bacterium]
MSELRHRQRMLVECDGKSVLLIVTSAGIVALDPTCPHQHVRSLDRGTTDGDTIVCPNHGWTFSLRTGKAIVGSGCIRLYPVHTTDAEAIVELPDERPRWMQY